MLSSFLRLSWCSISANVQTDCKQDDSWSDLRAVRPLRLYQEQYHATVG